MSSLTLRRLISKHIADIKNAQKLARNLYVKNQTGIVLSNWHLKLLKQGDVAIDLLQWLLKEDRDHNGI